MYFCHVHFFMGGGTVEDPQVKKYSLVLQADETDSTRAVKDCERCLLQKHKRTNYSDIYSKWTFMQLRSLLNKENNTAEGTIYIEMNALGGTHGKIQSISFGEKKYIYIYMDDCHF